MKIRAVLITLSLLFISNLCFAQISVRDDSTKTYLNFSKNMTVGLKLLQDYTQTRDLDSFSKAADYVNNSIEILNNSDEHMSDFMFNQAAEIANESRDLILNIEENQMAVQTMLFILSVQLDNYYKMIFLPETRKKSSDE